MNNKIAASRTVAPIQQFGTAFEDIRVKIERIAGVLCQMADSNPGAIKQLSRDEVELYFASDNRVRSIDEIMKRFTQRLVQNSR